MGQTPIPIQSEHTKAQEKRSNDDYKMVLFEISPFHPFYHSPTMRRGSCSRRGMTLGNNCMWMGHPAMELVLPVASSDVFSRRSNRNNNINQLRQEVTEKGVRFTLPIEGFDTSGLEVKVEDGALKIEARKEEKNEKGETVATRMMLQVVSLPEGCDKDAVETSFEENGVLAISIPRKTEAIEAGMTTEATKESQETKEAPQEATEETQKAPKEATQEAEEVEGVEKNHENHDSEEELRVLGTIPVMGFRPEELSVKVTKDGTAFEVVGRHEDPATGIFSGLNRVYPIPAGVEADKIEARMAKDGSELRVVAPLAPVEPEAEPEKNIPISMEVEH